MSCCVSLCPLRKSYFEISWRNFSFSRSIFDASSVGLRAGVGALRPRSFSPTPMGRFLSALSFHQRALLLWSAINCLSVPPVKPANVVWLISSVIATLPDVPSCSCVKVINWAPVASVGTADTVILPL